jgi:alkylated DNA repair dioxygenase AlkB
LTLKNRIETATGETFNSCLLNLYHSGDEGMAWHSDDEIDLKKMVLLVQLPLVLKENLLSNISISTRKWKCY